MRPLESTFPGQNVITGLFNRLVVSGARMGESRTTFFLFFLLWYLVLSKPFAAKAQFPYNESFKNSTAPSVNFGGDARAYLTAGVNPTTGAAAQDNEGEGYLRLTSNSAYQKGYVYSDNVFPGTYGLNIEFEYFSYGNSSGDGRGADGIAFFLFDATANPFRIGGFGG